MSFRGRMLVFFVIIVVIPMIAVALVLFSLTAESEVGKADSQLAGGLRVALALYEDRRDSAVDELRQVTGEEALQQAFLDGDQEEIARAAEEALSDRPALESAALFDDAGERIATVGAADGVAFATATPTDEDGDRIGRIAVSTTTADQYAREVAELTGLEARVVREGDALATTLEGGSAGDDSLATTVDAGGEEFRGRYAPVRDAVGPGVDVGVFQPASAISSTIADDRTLVASILLGFLLLAVASSILVVRSLGRQIDRFLGAARTVGRGDFAARVPAEGSDEFAALGREFNLMSARLEQNVEELDRRREEREEAIRRIGEAFATGLERSGIARLAARTAVEACAAESGHALPVHGDGIEPATVGSDEPELAAALAAAEHRARVSPDETVAVARDGAYALAAALRGGPQDGHRETLGYLAIARAGRPFDDSEQDLFTYLAAQASVSLDNAGLHETVQTQALTDPLTGLYNRRHFDAALEAEIGRTRRFGGDVGLVMLDLDRFKPVNDLYGHQEGDRVLVEAAALLRGLTRDVDQLARYGGDELAIILPQTDLAGSELLAERVRSGIESLSVRPAEAPVPLALTASFGVAALPETASDREALVGAADAALLRAKRDGGNRIARAEPASVPR